MKTSLLILFITNRFQIILINLLIVPGWMTLHKATLKNFPNLEIMRSAWSRGWVPVSPVWLWRWRQDMFKLRVGPTPAHHVVANPSFYNPLQFQPDLTYHRGGRAHSLIMVHYWGRYHVSLIKNLFTNGCYLIIFWK